jgi:hypothetical protein
LPRARFYARYPVAVILIPTPTPTLIPTPTPSLIQTPLGPFDWVALGSIGTLAAVLVALVLAIWGSWFGALAFKPKLRVSIEMQPPDCIRIGSVLGTRIVDGREYPVTWAAQSIPTSYP